MKRCIIYARIGGPASEVNNSLMQAQLAGLRAAAKCLGLEVVAELPVFEYGNDGNRQSIKTLARDRRHGLYECVLVKNLSRFGPWRGHSRSWPQIQQVPGFGLHTFRSC